MTETSLGFLVFVILLAVLFDFANGFNDAANAIATVISTRVLTPFVAILMAASMNFLGAITGTAVAKVVGSGVVTPEGITLITVAAGVGAAALWVLLASRLGLPISGSHSLIAGIAGAGLATGGFGVLEVESLIKKIILPLFFAPLVGFLGGFLLMLAIYLSFRRATPTLVNSLFSKLQIPTAAWLAFSHGSNDAQKTMGVITLALFVNNRIDTFDVPLWVIILSATVMGLGTYAGGRRVIATLGMRIVQMRPVHGFAASAAAASVIQSASIFGFPLSTTHVISACIMGQGSTQRLSAVRWGVAREILLAWVLTFPICGVLAALLYWGLRLVF